MFDNYINKTILVVGCGGLGCYVVDLLARAKINKLIIVDGDTFENSNLNRQIYCNYKTLGKYKVNIAQKYVENISQTEVIPINSFFPNKTVDKYIDEVDIIVDCLDNSKSKLELENYAKEYNKPLVHGSVDGMSGQVITILPGDDTLKKLYQNDSYNKADTISYLPSVVASLQVNEVVNIINNKEILQHRMLLIDLNNNTFKKVNL